MGKSNVLPLGQWQDQDLPKASLWLVKSVGQTCVLALLTKGSEKNPHSQLGKCHICSAAEMFWGCQLSFTA